MTGGIKMKANKRLLLPMNLQFFADDPNPDNPKSDNPNGSGTSSTNDSQNPKDENPDGKETGKTFTRDDVAKMVAAETKKAVEQAKSDWEKQKSYEQMTAEERVKAKEQEAADNLNDFRLLLDISEETFNKDMKPMRICQMMRLLIRLFS